MCTWVIETNRLILDKVAQATLYDTTGYKRSETEKQIDGEYTRFLVVSAELSLLELCRAMTEARKFSIGDIKFTM